MIIAKERMDLKVQLLGNQISETLRTKIYDDVIILNLISLIHFW